MKLNLRRQDTLLKMSKHILEKHDSPCGYVGLRQNLSQWSIFSHKLHLPHFSAILDKPISVNVHFRHDMKFTDARSATRLPHQLKSLPTASARQTLNPLLSNSCCYSAQKSRATCWVRKDNSLVSNYSN